MNTIERQITRDRGLLFMPSGAGVFGVPDNATVADGPTDGLADEADVVERGVVAHRPRGVGWQRLALPQSTVAGAG